MDAEPLPMDTHDLLADMDWLTRLAHRLVRDPALADDAVQEAWLAAKRRLAAGGSAEMPDRGLLGRTLRGMIQHGRRGAQRRQFHENRAARGEALPSTEELLLIGERQQSLWRHLSRLDEPYRSTLLLRFQAGLGPAEIGARSGDKEDTVRWRIRRGLELLRDSLESEDGGTGLLGMVPVAVLGVHPSSLGAAPLGAAAHITGVLWMTHKFLVTLSAAALLLVSAIYFLPGLMQSVEPRTAESTVAIDDIVVPLDPAAAPSFNGAALEWSSSERSSLLGAAPGVERAGELEQSVVAGRVVDERGFAVSGARVVAGITKGWEREVVTDVEGRFELACPVEAATVSVSVPAFEFYRRSGVMLGSSSSCSFPPLTVARTEVGDILLKRGSAIVGRLVDEGGDAVPDVWVIVRGLHPLQTNELGEFHLSGVSPDVDSLRINPGRHFGLAPAVELEAGRVLDLGEITLKELPRCHVHGRVVNEAGVPVPGARVYSPHEEVLAGADGAFKFAPHSRRQAILHANALGYRESCQTYCDDGAEVELVVRELGPLCQFLFVDGETEQPLSGVSMRVSEATRGRTITLGNGSWRYGARPGVSPTRFDVGPEHKSAADGRLDAHVLTEFDDVSVTASGYTSLDVVPTSEALQGGVQRVEMHRPRGAFITGAVPPGLGLEFPCVVEFHTLERLALHLPMEGVRDTEWESPPPTMTGGERGDQLDDWLGDAPVLRLKGRHRVHSNAQGQFRFKISGQQLVRAACYLDGDNSGRVAVSRLVCSSSDESTDLGAMVTTQLGTLTGHVVLPLPALAAELELGLEGRGKRASRLTGEGAFEFAGLIPGRYRMVSLETPEGVDRAPFERIVEVQPGTGPALIIDPELGEFGELEFTLSLNGAPPSKPFCVRLYADDDNFLGASDWSPGPEVHMLMPVGAGYRVGVEPDPGKLHNSGFELFDRFEVLPGKNIVHLEVQSSHLVCAVPAKYLDAEVSGWQFLLWKDSSGKERDPIQAGIHINGSHVPDEATGTIDIEFPCVPVDAQDLRLELQPWDPETDPRRTRLPFEAELGMGKVIRVVLE